MVIKKESLKPLDTNEDIAATMEQTEQVSSKLQGFPLWMMEGILGVVLSLIFYQAYITFGNHRMTGTFVFYPVLMFTFAMMFLIHKGYYTKSKLKLTWMVGEFALLLFVNNYICEQLSRSEEPSYLFGYLIFCGTLLLTFYTCSEIPRVVGIYQRCSYICNVLLLFLMSFFSFLMVELSMGQSIFAIDHSYWTFNLLIYLGMYGILYILTFRIKWTVILGIIVTTILGMANGYVVMFRGSPILPADLYLLKTALEVGGNYNFIPSTEMMIGLTLLVILLSFLVQMREKPKSFKKRMVGRGVGLVLFVIFSIVGVQKFEEVASTKLYMVNLWQPVRTYQRYGSAYGFGLNLVAMQVKEPEGYSEQKVGEILKNYTSDSVLSDSEEAPNVIVILDEAFSDLSVISSFETNEDYMPYYNSLSENTIKGYAYSSVVGGRTANSEYELLTGNTIGFLPAGTVPFQQYINGKTANMTSAFKQMQYQTIALHAYSRNTYRREIVYPLLGFEQYFASESFESPEYVRYYISDESDFNKIIELYENRDKSQPFYLYNVTMQNHSSYNTGLMETTIQLTGETKYEDVEEYLSCIRKTDEAMKGLLTYFKNQETPTYILFVGDHQPNFDSGFFEMLFGKKESELTTEELQKRYAVPFLIWSNQSLESKTVEAISMNYLASYFMKEANLPLTAYNKYLLDLYSKYPVVNVNGYLDSEGNWKDTSGFQQVKELQEYNMLVYHSVMNKSQSVIEKYQLKNQ